jgi:pyruvate,orthophosphate dikinase
VNKPPIDDKLFTWVLGLSEKYRKMRVTTSVCSNEDVHQAALFPSDGVLLHMDFLMKNVQDRTNLVQFLLMANTEQDREACLGVIQNELIMELKRIMARLPGRQFAFELLSAPLETFCRSDVNPTTIATSMNMSVADVKERLASLHDTNPALGLRGCRSFARFPRLLDICVAAIQSAMRSQASIAPTDVPPLQITLPLMSTSQEVSACVVSIRAIVPDATVGAVVATPRACLRLTGMTDCLDFVIYDVLALTELVWGCSREDAEHFLDQYLHDHRFPTSPFESLDRHGVGKLISDSVQKLRGAESPAFFQRSAKHHCEISLAGLPGHFDPAGITFTHNAGITNYISSPMCVPVAKLVSAQLAVQVDMDEPQIPVFPIM